MQNQQRPRLMFEHNFKSGLLVSTNCGLVMDRSHPHKVTKIKRKIDRI